MCICSAATAVALAGVICTCSTSVAGKILGGDGQPTRNGIHTSDPQINSIRIDPVITYIYTSHGERINTQINYTVKNRNPPGVKGAEISHLYYVPRLHT